MPALPSPDEPPPSSRPATERSRSGVVPRQEPPRLLLPREPEDPARVVEAMRALRQDKDPKRAQALLAEHLQHHPRGALSEEVLALSIEAAVARHDPKARDFARRYLAEYPKGRFRGLAVRTLAQNAK